MMITKISAIIVLLLAIVSTAADGVDAPVPVAGVPTASPVDAKKPVANFMFIINCTPPPPGKVGDNIHFEILVVSRTGTFSPDAEGLLEVFDAQGRILSSDLQPQLSGKNLKYEFDLSPKYLVKSRFAFKCTGVDEKGHKTADVLWAALLDYVKPSLR